MKKLFIAFIITGIIASCSETSKGSGDKVKLKTGVDTLSYCLGMNIGGSFKSLNTEINYEILNKAIQQVIAGEETKFSSQESSQILNMMANKLYMASVEHNRKAGMDLLEQNKADGIVTTESGLQYEILEEGTGPKPTLNDKVLCHYKGTMVDGTVFDSSYESGEPIEFPVTGVIPGWTEALQMMAVGSKWKIHIPSELAYGERPPRGSQIMPGSVLIFEMELLEILKNDSTDEKPADMEIMPSTN